MSTELPLSATVAWWGTAWLRGAEVTDHVLDALAGDGRVHTVSPVPVAPTDASGPGTAGPLGLLAALRRAGATSVGLALPVEGDPLGLGGPTAFNSAALEAGEAVVATGAGVGAVPHQVGHGVLWQLHVTSTRRTLADVGEADRGLRAALLEVSAELAALDVARWRPELADALMDLRHRPALDAPAGTPPRCVELAARALQAKAIVDLALENQGAALSASQMHQRESALRPLDLAARRALVAAFSPEAWPEG